MIVLVAWDFDLKIAPLLKCQRGCTPMVLARYIPTASSQRTNCTNCPQHVVIIVNHKCFTYPLSLELCVQNSLLPVLDEGGVAILTPRVGGVGELIWRSGPLIH